MEFLSKHWPRLTIILISLTAFILVMVQLAGTGVLPASLRPGFMGSAMAVGYLLFFTGVIAHCVLSIMDRAKKIRAYILFGAGVLVTIFMILGLVNAIDTWRSAFHSWEVNEQNPAQYSWAKFVVFPITIQLFAFGLFPLVLGTKQIIDGLGSKKPTEEVAAEKEEAVQE